MQWDCRYDNFVQRPMNTISIFIMNILIDIVNKFFKYIKLLI